MSQTYALSSETSFSKANIEDTTILLGNLSTAANRLLRATLQNLGYLAQNLPHANLDAFHLGREYSNKGQCNPVYFTVGNLLAFLEDLHYEQGLSREYIVAHYAFITAGSCGPCRFGMYESEYRLALEGAGYKGFRVILFQQSLNQNSKDSGLNFSYYFFLSLIEAVMLADHLNEMRYRLEPYEKNKGEVAETFEKSLRLLENHLLTEKWQHPFEAEGGLLYAFYHKVLRVKQKKLLRRIAHSFEKIELELNKVVPVVKITGEFWAQTTEGDGNFQMFNFLKSEGAEVLVEPISGWLLYLLWLEMQLRGEKRGGKSKDRSLWGWLRLQGEWLSFQVKMRLAVFLFAWRYKKLGKLLGNFTRPLVSMHKLASFSRPFIDVRYDGGEGHLEIAKNIYYSQKGLAHMVLSVKPFGCMPSTISDSVQNKVIEKFPGITFLSVETSSEGKINAYSRVQMQLTQARAKAKKETENALGHFREKKIFFALRSHPQRHNAKNLKLVLKASGMPAAKLARIVQNGFYRPLASAAKER